MNISKAKRVIKEYPQARDFLKQYEKCQNAWKDYGFSNSADFIITLMELEDTQSRANILKKFREKVSKGKGKRRTRLSEEVRKDIRGKAGNGVSRRELAQTYGVSYQTISKIINHPD
jgi:DNA-binding transcriptional regulator YiaG